MKKVKIKAAAGATHWGIINLDEVRTIDEHAVLSSDKHKVYLSNGEVLNPRDILNEDMSIERGEVTNVR